MLLAFIIVAARCFWLTTESNPLGCFQASMKEYLESGAVDAVRIAIVEAFQEFQYEEVEGRLSKIIREHQMGMQQLLFHCLL